MGYKVLLKKGTLIDENRNGRGVDFKLYYPADHGLERIPLIIWSHGFGGNKDGAAFLSRHLAAQGYFVLHPTHHGTDSSIWEGKPGHPWDILREYKVPRADTLHRFNDIPFLLDVLPDWAATHDEIGSFIDFGNIGMSGHSFGALTTQVMAGQKFPDENGDLISMTDDRFKSFIAYSPVPIGHLYQGEEDQIYSPIRGPFFFMTGTQDHSPLEEFGYERRLVIHDLAQADDKYVHILDGGDHMVYNGTRGKLTENPMREQHEADIMKAALQFWDATLKDDAKAKEWLDANHIRSI